MSLLILLIGKQVMSSVGAFNLMALYNASSTPLHFLTDLQGKE